MDYQTWLTEFHTEFARWMGQGWTAKDSEALGWDDSVMRGYYDQGADAVDAAANEYDALVSSS